MMPFLIYYHHELSCAGGRFICHSDIWLMLRALERHPSRLMNAKINKSGENENENGNYRPAGIPQRRPGHKS